MLPTSESHNAENQQHVSALLHNVRNELLSDRSSGIFMLAASKRNITVWRLSVRLSVRLCLSRSHILDMTHHEAACDTASVHFRPIIMSITCSQ